MNTAAALPSEMCPKLTIKKSCNSQLQLPLNDSFVKDLVQLDAQQFCIAIFWACWIGSAALQGSHPVPEATDGAGARHLQVGAFQCNS